MRMPLLLLHGLLDVHGRVDHPEGVDVVLGARVLKHAESKRENFSIVFGLAYIFFGGGVR